MTGERLHAGSMQRHDLTVEKFLDHAAKWHPDVTVASAGPDGVVRTGYAELRREAGQLAAALSARGITRGDMIATLGWNTKGHVLLWYAAAAIGAICHTLNPRLSAAQLAAMTARSRPRLLLYGSGLSSLASEVTNGALATIAIDDPERSAGTSLSELITGGEGNMAPVWGAALEDDPAGLCFTSGTTGPPKGVLYTHRSNYLHTLRLLQADALALTTDDRVLPIVPMFHANGWGIPFAAPAVGAGLVLPGRNLDGASLAGLIASEAVTVAAGVPTVWLDLLDHVERHGIALPSLQRIYLGGAAMPIDAQRRLERGLGVSVHASWGMTELSPLGTVAPHGVDRTRPGSAGRAPIGLDLRLTDVSGAVLAEQREAEGHLQVRGPSVVRRYFGAVQDATDSEGWFDTGDLARIDPDGSLTITGRAKDLIKSGGEWINPGEIERIVAEGLDTGMVAVIARADAKWGERPVLIYEASADVDVEALLDGRIPRWWMPDAIVRIDRMPLAVTGKIDKLALRATFGAAEAVASDAVLRA